MNKVNENILKRYLSGNYSASDERYITEQFADKDQVKELKKLMKVDWKQTAEGKGKKDLSHVLEAIHSKIVPAKKNGRILRLYSVYSRIAAIILLPLMLWFLWNHVNNDEQQLEQAMTAIHAPQGSKVRFVLPDGTSGWLKGGSELSYSTNFNQRHVALEGEAYFDVQHNAKKPFEVVGEASKIVVLGTKFSANMWPKSKTTEVVLESGSVKFVANNNDATILKPGEKLVYQKQNQNVKVAKANTSEYTAWVKGTLIIRGDNLKQLASKLSDWYNVDVVLDGEYPADYQFRATFKNESVDEVLRLIKLTAPISYQIKPQIQLDDGTYSKMQITLKMHKQ